jgi:hypothetical protein
MASQTTELMKSYMSENGNNSIYLAVVKATSAPNTSVAMQILHEANLYPKTLGVFTFCDEMGRKHARRLKQWMREPADGKWLQRFTLYIGYSFQYIPWHLTAAEFPRARSSGARAVGVGGNDECSPRR